MLTPCHDYRQALVTVSVKMRMTFFKPLTLTNYQLELKTYNKRLSMTVCYQKFYNNTLQGWPNSTDHLPEALKPYYHRKDQLTAEQGCVL